MIQTLLEQCQPRILLAEINPITTFLLAWLVICDYGQPSSAEEMAKIEGELRNIPQQENGIPIFAKGVFSYDQSVREGHGYATGLLQGELDLIRFRAGNDQPHNNVPPCLATYCWRRQA